MALCLKHFDLKLYLLNFFSWFSNVIVHFTNFTNIKLFCISINSNNFTKYSFVFFSLYSIVLSLSVWFFSLTFIANIYSVKCKSFWYPKILSCNDICPFANTIVILGVTDCSLLSWISHCRNPKLDLNLVVFWFVALHCFIIFKARLTII